MSAIKKIYKALPESIRDTALVRTFGLFKVPLLFWISPTVVELSKERCEVRIPLNRKTKNHLKSMYFGVLAAGADCAGGLAAMKLIIESGQNVSLAFKDFKAEFHQRAEADTHFICNQGKEIADFVTKVVESGERHHMPVEIVAICPKISQEPVATFTLTLSLKNKSKKS
ncbi:PaaI family thioesterase [Bacteriovorax sp. Seq25_V]|uniref:PaaI family thioesterase n=1 Tax=Bacteriovorax sp. Seq25_V TaxID=1201288 RepID=UPI00038A0AD4|nr:DUF4442 domain-containing protein [Bacteriovorax sp. Seq25_V]EQC48027.1 hypothetical protein M900_1105 [Bacteriovorax sp. Seq25_V]